jgi:hypothetical protein
MYIWESCLMLEVIQGEFRTYIVMVEQNVLFMVSRLA